MNKLYLYVTCLITVLSAACSNIEASKIDPSQVYTRYQANYSEDTQTLTNTAWFSAGAGLIATDVDLDGESTVSANGVTLQKSTSIIDDVSYESSASLSADAVASLPVSFRYVDESGKVYLNTVQIPQKVNVTQVGYDADGNLLVSWQIATPLADNETLNFTLQDQNKATLLYANNTNQYLTGTSSFSKSALQTLQGTGYLQYCRTQSISSINAPSVGGNLSATYCGKIVSVAIQH